jgi:hypothetical protein
MSGFFLAILVIIVASFFIWGVFRWPDFFFWVFLMLILDPSGYFTIFFDKEAWGGIYYQDLIFPLLFLPIFSPKVDKSGLWKDKMFKMVLVAELIFFFYHLVVYGYIVPGNDLNTYVRFFLVRWRMSVFGFFVLIPVYIMAKRNMGLFVDILVFTTVIVFSVFFIQLLAGLEIFPIMQFERYKGSGIMRYSLFSTGLADYTIPLALFVFLLKIPYRYKNLLYVAASMVFVSIIIALTKSVYISLFAYIFTVFFLMYKLFNYPVMSLFKRGTMFSLFLGVALLISFPQYVDYSARLGKDIYLFLIGNPYTSGVTEARLDNQVPAHMSIIYQAPFFGAGAVSDRYSSLKYDESDYEISDLPVTGHIAYFGIVGMLIYILFYVQIIRVMRKLYKFLKPRMSLEFLQQNRLEIGMVFISFAFFFKTLIFRPNYLFKEITYDRITINFFAGIMLAAFYRMREKYNNRESLETSDSFNIKPEDSDNQK